MNSIDWEVLLRLILGMFSGGIIGLERESSNRPAGFRTHTLVCMGSVLVMLTSSYLFSAYFPDTKPDPARLGAQVISGIGFLGAGTILKDGSRVRGLTTAASLWVVACIGLAIGAGFYSGAIIATVCSYITLVLLRRLERIMPSKNNEFHVDILNKPGQIANVTHLFKELHIRVRDIHVVQGEGEYTQAFFKVILPPGLDRYAVEGELNRLPGIKVVYEE
ncbi:MAG: MgtC/SapB family protein [Caldicoprobacterales bacterium]